MLVGVTPKRRAVPRGMSTLPGLQCRRFATRQRLGLVTGGHQRDKDIRIRNECGQGEAPSHTLYQGNLDNGFSNVMHKDGLDLVDATVNEGNAGQELCVCANPGQ